MHAELHQNCKQGSNIDKTTTTRYSEIENLYKLEKVF